MGAIFNIIAAVFADTDASTDVGALTNLNCARNLDAMFEINEGAIIRNVDGTIYEPEADVVTGDIPGAVSFPTWFVAIGSNDDGLGATGFVVPNGFCYTNACMTEFLKTATANGGSKMGKLIKDPNMANPVTSTSALPCGTARSGPSRWRPTWPPLAPAMMQASLKQPLSTTGRPSFRLLFLILLPTRRLSRRSGAPCSKFEGAGGEAGCAPPPPPSCFSRALFFSQKKKKKKKKK